MTGDSAAIRWSPAIRGPNETTTSIPSSDSKHRTNQNPHNQANSGFGGGGGFGQPVTTWPNVKRRGKKVSTHNTISAASAVAGTHNRFTNDSGFNFNNDYGGSWNSGGGGSNLFATNPNFFSGN